MVFSKWRPLSGKTRQFMIHIFLGWESERERRHTKKYENLETEAKTEGPSTAASAASFLPLFGLLFLLLNINIKITFRLSNSSLPFFPRVVISEQIFTKRTITEHAAEIFLVGEGAKVSRQSGTTILHIHTFSQTPRQRTHWRRKKGRGLREFSKQTTWG